MKNKELILILDFGGQYNQLIARRVRECNVYSEVVPFDISIDKIKETSISTIFASIFQVVGLLFLIIMNKFTLKYLALCCSFTEFMLFALRIGIVYKNIKLFKLNKEGIVND